jgi:hypothetical protein
MLVVPGAAEFEADIGDAVLPEDMDVHGMKADQVLQPFRSGDPGHAFRHMV